jgi:hypothetical protein
MNRQKKAADWAARRRGRQVRGIITSLVLLAALVAVTFMFRRIPALEVVSVVPATALDDRYRAVEAADVYGPGDTFFVSVQLKGYKPDMAISARWRYEGEVITETPLETVDAGEGYAGFALWNEASAWPVGRYMVEIVYQGESLASAAFSVQE